MFGEFRYLMNTVTTTTTTATTTTIIIIIIIILFFFIILITTTITRTFTQHSDGFTPSRRLTSEEINI
ncbi:unnamed protein product [Schistocephalus solidus]|uniref:Uncharacterized protein n=1 Tax=Schistocephalus solidus TaxID=70667 RepID=A0A183T194_SCHSO|nr:unnamed protein product [Schistocephalus solidus]